MTSQTEILTFAAGLLVFWLFVNLLHKALSLERYGLKLSWVFIRYDSQGFKAFIEKASQWRPKAWRAFSNLSLGLGVGLMAFSIYFLSDNLVKFVKPGGVGSPVVPVLPGLTIQVHWLPYFVLAFLLAALTHEIAHGVVARLEGVRVKSAGLFLAVVQPGGFVEPDDRSLEDSPTVSKMRILSAGSSINLLTGLLVFLLLAVMFFGAPSGVVVMGVLEDGPLERAGVQRWDVIYAINGTQIRTTQDLGELMDNVTPGDRLVLSTSRGDLLMASGSDPDDPDRAVIGITSSMPYFVSRLGLGFFWDTQVYTTLNWMFFLLVNLAIISMLPIPLFDGDRFLQYFLQKYGKGDQMKMFFNAASLFLIVANMALSMTSGLFPF